MRKEPSLVKLTQRRLFHVIMGGGNTSAKCEGDQTEEKGNHAENGYRKESLGRELFTHRADLTSTENAAELADQIHRFACREASARYFSQDWS